MNAEAPLKATTTISVRRATTDDAPILGRLGALLVSVHHEFDEARFISATAATERAYGVFLSGQIGREEVTLLVAEEAGHVLGYAYAGLEGNDYMALRGPAGVVYDLVVDPERRNEGIGRALLQTTISSKI